MNKEEKNPPVSVENIYRLNGRVPLQKAIPFGLQHVLAMFVSNLAPVLIVCSAAIVRSTGEHLTSAEITRLLQCAMFAAGIGTCMQLYPIWKIGSRLPIVMGGQLYFSGKPAGDHDRSDQPVYHLYRSIDPDPGITLSAAGSFLQFSAPGSAGRLYGYDVWFYYVRRDQDAEGM